ncbi:hypothetical protein FHT40_001472 [Mycolicibacterium sp. BK556]|uniref:hypothetical protein n=1 Tax=Mycobacteriaceae TaxID=1762 RepID=UPI00105D13BD|nr:hypothetical protein [Mycobacterium sp. BK086]MBB3601839.1 hypothetical protein [Mycolicibacterium sp. BK556]MBB3631591.1 hypothetical protein [Mycolicibacterium sp. BK607]MBB3749595.1 hypothetical protein [Mycolicibacterium sp. BK634]TDO14188.1 hypothetical protein EV580_2312 [Mycobacterium sp. BK086]
MKKQLAVGIGAVGAAAASFAMFGTGVASATNEYAGQTYADAAQAISDSGQSATIATRVGSFLPTDQCMVTGSRSANFLDSSGTNPGGRVLLYLNCNNTFATAGVPGNSIGSPEGRAARSDYEEKLAEAQAEAEQSESSELEQTGNVPGEAGQVAGG